MYSLARWLSIIFFGLLLFIFKGRPNIAMMGSFVLMAVLWYNPIRRYFRSLR